MSLKKILLIIAKYAAYLCLVIVISFVLPRLIPGSPLNVLAGEGSGYTEIFIYPGYKFKATDALITNFHLPESTLIMLVSALAGKENVELMLVKGKGHNPNYTADAVKYKDAFFATLQKKRKKGQLETIEQKAAVVGSYDWDRMTAQDETVWAKVYEALEK